MECLFYFSNDCCVFDSSATASWLQFMGSMMALALAILLPDWTRKKDRQAHFEHVNESVSTLISQLKKMTENLTDVLTKGVTKNKIPQIQHAYAKTANQIMRQIDSVTLHDVHNSKVLMSLAILRYSAEKGIDEIVANWPSLASDFGVKEVPDSVSSLLAMIKQVEENLAKLPKP